MIEAYIKKFNDLSTYIAQDDLEQLVIGTPHIFRIIYAQEKCITEMEKEVKNLRDLVDGFLLTRQLLGDQHAS